MMNQQTSQPGLLSGLLSGIPNPIPVNMRQYVSYLSGDRTPLTEANLWPSDIQAIKNAVGRQINTTKSNSGVIGYGDYGAKPDQFSSFGTSPGPLGLLVDSFTDPKFRMETTLGMANYNVDPKGNVIVSDRYNFNARNSDVQNALASHGGQLGTLLWALRTRGFPGLLNAAGNMYGGTEDDPGVPVRINLGPVSGLLAPK